MRRVVEETTGIWALTHRGYILDDASELIKDGLSGDAAPIDGITAGDGLESVMRPILIGLPLQLRRAPKRARCDGEIGVAGLDEVLIKSVEWTGCEIGPHVRGVEGVEDRVHEVDRLEIVVPARPGVIVGDLPEA